MLKKTRKSSDGAVVQVWPVWSCPGSQETGCWRCSGPEWFHKTAPRPHLQHAGRVKRSADTDYHQQRNHIFDPHRKLILCFLQEIYCQQMLVGLCVCVCVCVCVLPVKPQASASRNVLQDMRKNRAVSNSWKSLSLVNFVTYSRQSRSLTRHWDTARWTPIKLLSIIHNVRERTGGIILFFNQSKVMCYKGSPGWTRILMEKMSLLKIIATPIFKQ